MTVVCLNLNLGHILTKSVLCILQQYSHSLHDVPCCYSVSHKVECMM